MMKVARLSLRAQGVCRNASKNFFCSSSSKSPSPTAPSAISESENTNSPHKLPTFPNKTEPNASLYRRISPVGDPDISIVPILDQWVREGRKADKNGLETIIKSLKKYRRFKHALEISEWMTDKRYIPLTKGDIMSRLHLTYKVYGLEKAENFYNKISNIFKGFEVDTTLLNIYCLDKSVDKAEALMQKLRETGCLMTSLPFNLMLNLYHNIGNYEKMDALTNEMEHKGIYGDKYSFTPRLCAYAATGNIEVLNKIMEIIEADSHVVVDCDSYFIAANAFLKVGFVEKCLELLKKAEKMAIMSKGKYKTLNNVLKTYAVLGKKDEVERIWKILNKTKIYNTGYKTMISSLLKFDDIEGAERIFKKWETEGLSYDFRILDDLIDAYVKKGELMKAENLLNCGIEKGGVPTFGTWYCLMIGYFEDDNILKGVEALKNATESCRVLPSEERVKGKLGFLLGYLERRRNMEEMGEFVGLLEEEGIFSSIVCEKLLHFVKNES